MEFVLHDVFDSFLFVGSNPTRGDIFNNFLCGQCRGPLHMANVSDDSEVIENNKGPARSNTITTIP